MELFLQFGHGMKGLTLDLSKKWGGASVVLSPRDMTPLQLERWSKDFETNKVSCYFDPQCYCPKGDPKCLVNYKYWDTNLNTNLQAGMSSIEQKLEYIKLYNDIAKTKAYILPSILNPYEADWDATFISQLKLFIKYAHKQMTDKPIFATLALPKEFLVQSETTIEPVLQQILDLDVDGYYIIAEALDKKYLTDNPMWLSNIFHICAAIKILGKKVIYGYGNHQLLPLALIQIDAMASGTWLNVRSFTNRFINTDEQRRRSTWVYYPEALSEYKLSFLDWAFNIECLPTMQSKDKDFLDENINKIFKANVPPSSTGFNETDAFKHYLCCLKHQVGLLEKKTYEEAFESYAMILNTAEREIERLEKAGVYAQTRSFKNFIDVNRAAITRLDKNHGFALKMSWKAKN